MDVIELECPHCGDALELDAAFAGGVCRCSTCGTLMTVPADPSRGRAETVTRRDRPDAPPGAPAPGGGRPDTPRPDAPRSARPDVPGTRPETPGGTGSRPEVPSADLAALASAAPPGSSASSSQGVYYTASGQSLELAEAVVPTARKKKKVIKATVIGGFIAMVLGIVVVIALAINFVFNTDSGNGDDPKAGALDPAVNPFKSPEANVLTIAIAGECAIVIDATATARQWYEMMKDVIGHEVSLASSTSFMIIPWTDLTPKAFPTKPEKIGRDRLSELDAAMSQSPVNTASPVPFVELALAERCDQIILITGSQLDEAVVNSLREAINKRVDTQLDVIVIGDHDEALQKLAAENKGPAKKGRYVSVTTEQLRTWYEEWKK